MKLAHLTDEQARALLEEVALRFGYLGGVEDTRLLADIDTALEQASRYRDLTK